MAERDTHRISAKIAIYSPDSLAILAMEYPKKSKFALPGGHIDIGETPEEALERELMEELKLDIAYVEDVRKRDFFRHRSGKIVLAFSGILSPETVFVPQQPMKEVGTWLSRSELETVNIEETYRQFGLSVWPDNNRRL